MKSFMHFALLISKVCFFAATISAANVKAPTDSEKALQKSALKGLKSRYSGAHEDRAEVKTFDLTDRASTQSQGGFHEIPCDVQVHILAFLSARDLLNTTLVSPLYYNLSHQANFMNLLNQNRNFVLEENWMNMAMSDFLQKHFEEGIFNIDDLLVAVYRVIFKKNENGQSPTPSTSTLTLLSFLYEYQNGPNSHLPFIPVDYLVDVLRNNYKHCIPKSLKLLDQYFYIFSEKSSFPREPYMQFVHGAIEFMASNPSREEIMTVLNFDPANPITDSSLGRMPTFLQIALFDLILPICDDVQRVHEALDITSACFATSQTLFNQFDSKFPEFLSDLNDFYDNLLAPLQKLFVKRFPKADVIGLDYLVTRDSANPFNLQELQAMKPDYWRLMVEFFRTNTMTLTELDMIYQIKEAGLLDAFDHPEYQNMINDLLTGQHRTRLSSLVI